VTVLRDNKINWMPWFLKFIFGIKLYMFRTIPLSAIRSFSLHTQQYIQVCWQFASRIRMEAVSKPVWHIPLLCVQWKTLDVGQRNCPKHEEFYSKNKFQKLVHLVGFIIRIYRDARSPERQINNMTRWARFYISVSVYACVQQYQLCGSGTWALEKWDIPE